MTDLPTNFLSRYRLIAIVVFFFFASTLTVNLISLHAQREPIPIALTPEGDGKVTIPDPKSSPPTLEVKLTDGKISQIPLDTITSPPSAKEKDIKILISYIYTESPSSYTNLLFFIKHGLHSYADFVFVLNGKLDKEKYDYVTMFDVEKGDGRNIRVLEREKGTCFELGTLKEVLSKEEKRGDVGKKTLMDRYDRFILLSSKVKGPFVEEGKRGCWSELYLKRLSESVKMVGSKTLCPEPDVPYLPFTVWALGKTGLDTLLEPTAIGDQCFNTEAEQDIAEIRITPLFLDMKQELSVMDSASQRAPPDGGLLCGGITDTGFSSEREIFDMMFVKSKEGDELLEELSEKQGKSDFSSFDVCGKMTVVDMEIENR